MNDLRKGWEWKQDIYAYQKNNGRFYVLVNKQLFGRWLVQKYPDLKSLIVENIFISYDEDEAFKKAEEWLEL